MEESEIVLKEYSLLWNEKLIHKQGIRKFHNYLTYISAIGSLALTFYGVSTQDFFKAAIDPQTGNHLVKNAANIVHLFFVPFAPVVFVTLTFPINNLFHIYVIGNQIACIERKLNHMTDKNLLVWEHLVCPAVYQGDVSDKKNKVTNPISLGDYLLLFPFLIGLCGVSVYLSVGFINSKFGSMFMWIYAGIVAYMFLAIIFLGLKLFVAIKSRSKLGRLIKSRNGISEALKEGEPLNVSLSKEATSLGSE